MEPDQGPSGIIGPFSLGALVAKKKKSAAALVMDNFSWSSPFGHSPFTLLRLPAAWFFITMSLRSHLDRYCLRQAMARDSISPSTRSRSPTRAPTSSSITSPFHRPQGMNLPATTPHRPVILKVDLKPMQQLADKNPYYNIMAPKVAGNISTETYESLFQTYKVIYPDYASRHFVTDLKTLVMDTMLQRWSIHLHTDF